MKGKRRALISGSASSTINYRFAKHNSPTEIPIQSPINDHRSSSAARIQAAYRSYVVRRLLGRIAAVESEVERMERRIQRQETVDALRSSNNKEKLRIDEELMRLLLDLDSVPGRDPGVRELRRGVSRRILGLQEVVDAICFVGMEEGWDWDWDWDWNWNCDATAIGQMEEQVCREIGGEELERLCQLHLGFPCFHRFLRRT